MFDKYIFIAYPADPSTVGQTIEEAAKMYASAPPKFPIITWRQIDIPGRFIAEGVLEKIDRSNYFAADITCLNFNVIFEIGYSIGRGKRTVPILNKALNPEIRNIQQLGIFDTLGYQTYENSFDLVSNLSKIADISPISFINYPIDRNAPIFIMDTLYKTDASIRIMSKVKKSRIKFRSFDPKEQPRLSTLEAYRGVKQSITVIINLISSRATDYYLNNLRGAFLAGLSYGLEKELLILQEGDEPVPVDYRDFVSIYKHPYDVDKFINELAPKVMEKLQSSEEQKVIKAETILGNIDIGATAAENEMSALGNYYVQTSEFNQALAGSVRLAVGRKGSGKTALFFQVRDHIRSNKKNIVLDLKPEGYQLKRFKDVLHLLGQAVQEHVATAFWEYVLLLEICNKILEKDRVVHTRDHSLYEPYQRLAKLYAQDDIVEEGDFSERILKLVNRITCEFEGRYQGEKHFYLSIPEVNELIYKHDIPELRQELMQYLQNKNSVWLLFDNIDKGWPTRGISETDILILRALLEATRKIERSFGKSRIQVISIIFLRNDVYELLVDESPDRGKESKVSLDWKDRDGLRELLRRRLIYSGLNQAISFWDAWRTICVSHIDGEESSEYLIERSLMRPRNFLNLFNYSKSNAINLQHSKIEGDDIKKACAIYSADLVNEIGLEIRDVFSEAEDILYYFIGASSHLNLKQIQEYLSHSPVSPERHNQLIEILLWFGVLGGRKRIKEDIQDIYIQDVYYDMKKLKKIVQDFQNGMVEFVIHPAFWPFLEIVEI